MNVIVEAGGAPVKPGDSAEDTCICKGNWQLIIKEAAPLMDNQFVQESTGNIYTFWGVLHGSDDYYYVMSRDGKVQLLSCVGSIEEAGFRLLAR
ncbi:MAG: hypothetical protein Q7S87_03255 [Agitococcus sp.]|nr:hypothetical protein [Agitococcus sp.]MDO9178653.1 hypothetical protein [Agitococcus sp.]